jgi:raffinose/stachyose/melibiose transport system substrate-binding protein
MIDRRGSTKYNSPAFCHPVKTHRHFILLLLSAVFLSALSACNSTQGLKKGELVIWHWMTDREDALQDLADQYQKEKGLKVHLELYAPSDAYSSKVRASAQTDSLPDIFGVLGESRDLASFINSGHVANLEPEMMADKKAWYSTFFPSALATNTFHEDNQYKVPTGIYGVPIDVTNIQMLYNKDLFKQAGLDPEKAPRTWDEWMEDWHKLKAAHIPGFVSGWGETWMIGCFANNYAFNIMGEEKVLDTYRGKVSYTDPDWIRVLSLFEQLRKEDILVSGVVTMVNKNAEQTFANGKAAFSFNGSWCVNVYKGMSPDLQYAVMLPPKVSNAYPMKIWGGAGSSFMVNPHSPNREEAVAFLKWLTAPAQQTVLSKDTLNLPSIRASTLQLPPVLAEFSSKTDATTHPSQWPVTEDPTVSEAFNKGIQSILIGEKTASQVAAELAKMKKQKKRS